MKRIKTAVAALLISVMGISMLTACGKGKQTVTLLGDPAKPTKKPEPTEAAIDYRAMDAFELAEVINKNSHIDIGLLGKVGEDGKDYSTDSGDVVAPAGYNGEVRAYGFPYPSDSGTVYWTQVYVENKKNDLLGIHVGDRISDTAVIMEQYGFDYSETRDRVYTSKEADHYDIYQNGDVYFHFYLGGEKLVYMLVTVHGDTPDDRVY